MRFVTRRLRGSDSPLTDQFDVALLDLDGVVYIGPDAVPGVPRALASARSAGMHLAFVTNNASRTPQDVAQHLAELGIDAAVHEVITSSQAAARYLAERLGPGAVVLVVGTTALAAALRERGLSPVLAGADGAVTDDVVAVVQGYSPETNWRMLADAAVAIGRGALWVATNVDPTVPSARGPLPGNGSLVHALRHATGAVPVVTGKPDPTMHRETVIRTGAKHPLVVGDRLDTDIEGANAVGCASLLVLSGVTSAADLLAAPDRLRPDFLARDASGLLETHPAPSADHGSGRCGSWEARRAEAGWQLRFTGAGGAGDGAKPAVEDSHDDGLTASWLDALRALCAAVWSACDAASRSGHGGSAGDDHARSEEPAVVAASGDDAAAAAIAVLGLDH